MTDVRGYTRKDVDRLYDPRNQHGVKVVSGVLDATTTTEEIVFGDVCERISIQTENDLVVDIFVSVNGKDWVDTTLDGTAAAIVTYNTHNISAVRVVRSAGTGKVYILGNM
jgi:hypothetical protein